MSEVTLYGEWMRVYHSVKYNKLPDWFIAYDIWVVEDRRFLAPNIVEDILSKTSISYIKPHKTVLSNVENVIKWSELQSDYTDGTREGIVIKTIDEIHIKDFFKVVNKHFNRRDNFNDELIKNSLIIK